MSRFVDDPSLLLPAFEPRFGVRRLIVDRGGIYDKRIRDGLLNGLPTGSMLDSLHGTLVALDPLVVALAFAGYDAREAVVAASSYGDPSRHDLGCLRASLRSGLGVNTAGNWPAATHIVDDGTSHSIVALRVLTWRQPADPDVVPVDLSGVTAYQRHRDPADRDGTDDDGWIVLGDPNALVSSELVGAALPTVMRQVVAAIEGAAGPSPGLVRLLHPAGWEVPRDRDAPVPALRAVAEIIWEGRLSQPGSLAAFLGVDASGTVALDDGANELGQLVTELDPVMGRTILGDLADELERRRVAVEPLEATLPAVLRRLAKTHWALALMQLHEYGLVNLVPLPAPSPPAIPVVDLTGFYSSITDAATGLIATMQLNQAGDEVRGFWIDDALEIWPIEGTFTGGPGEFRFSLTSTWDGSTGSLSLPAPPSADPRAFGFHVDWPAHWSMARRDRRARLDPGVVVASLPAAPPAGTLEPLLLPLHWLHAQRITSFDVDLMDHLELVTGLINTNASFAVQSMDGDLVSTALADDLVSEAEDGSFVLTPLLRRFRAEVRQHLAARSVSGAPTVDAWFQLQSVVDQYPTESRRIQALLDVHPGAAHSYEYTLQGAGVEVSVEAIGGIAVGGFTIGSDITHQASCAGVDTEPAWTERYTGAMYLGGPSVGFQGGADVVLAFHEFGSNELITADEWLRDDFLCYFVAGELSVSAGLYPGALGPGGDIGAEPWEGYTFFRGRDGAPASGQGGGYFVQGGVGAKAGMGAGLVGQWGYYSSRSGVTAPSPPPPGPPPTLEVRGADSAVAYFAVDSATLTEEGKRVVKDIALTYRPLLDDAGSYLILEGDASRTGDSAYNVDLSRRRLLAVYDHLHSLLTTPAIGDLGPSCALAVTDSHVMFTAHGESRPAWAGLPDEIESAPWRRATIVVSGQCLETFQVAGVLVTSAGAP